jgi:hypothetical protein
VRFAHTPLPKSRRATLTPSTSFILELHRIARRDHALMNVFPNEKNGMRVKPLPVSRETTERGGGLPTLIPFG